MASTSTALKKYKRIKYLGKGSYGAAILAELRSNGQKFVIKEIVIGHLKPHEQAAAKKEAEVLSAMSHSNITLYIESFVEASKLYIVMEHADGGDLSTAVQRRKTGFNGKKQFYAENELMRIFVQICLALKHVHDQNILHRDLKSQNIFLTSQGIVKLGDFGIAKVLDASEEQARTQIGTPYYLSPEICESLPYGRSSDVWSIGIVLFELLALELPFQATSLPALVGKICNHEPNWGLVKPSSAVPSSDASTGVYSETVLDLTKQLLAKNASARPSVRAIVSTDYLKLHMSRLLSHTLRVGNGGAPATTKDDIIDEEASPPPDYEYDDDELFQRGQKDQASAPRASHHRPQQLAPTSSPDVEEVERRIELERQRQMRSKADAEAVRKESALLAEKDRQRSEAREKLKRFKEQCKIGMADPTLQRGDVIVASPSVSSLSPSPAERQGVRNIDRDITPSRDRSKGHGWQQQLPAPSHYYSPDNRGGRHDYYEQQDHEYHRGAPRSRSLLELQAEGMLRPRENVQDRNIAPPREHSRQQHQEHQQYSQPSTRQPSNEMEIRGPDPYRQPAQVDDEVRRQFFANRAAAAAVKARVEREERGDPIFLNHDSPMRDAIPFSHQKDRDPYSYPSHESDRAEVRIQQLRRQKEREKERERAHAEQVLLEAHAFNRELRQARPAARGEVIEIDISPLREKSEGGQAAAIRSSGHKGEVSRGLPRSLIEVASMHGENIKGSPPIAPSLPPASRWGPPASVTELREKMNKMQSEATVDAGTPPRASYMQSSSARSDGEVQNTSELKVLDRIAKRRVIEEQARNDARVVFRRLQEQRRKIRAGRGTKDVEHGAVPSEATPATSEQHEAEEELNSSLGQGQGQNSLSGAVASLGVLLAQELLE